MPLQNQIPTEIIQAIFLFIDPLDVLRYRGLCRSIRHCLTDDHFALSNLKHFVPPSDQITTHKNSASPYDILWFRWPLEQYKTAYANLLANTIQHIDWEAKPEGNSITGWPLLNQTFGMIPSQIGSLVKLKELFLGRNGLSGEIPPQLGLLSHLEILHLPRNNLSGNIPPELGKLSNLTILSLEDNNLTGPLPVQLWNLTRLESLHVNMNSLSGEIPPGISRLVNLMTVSFDSNLFTGKVPVELGSMEKLRWPLLQWQANRFDQVLPSGMRREGRVWIALIRQGFRPDDVDDSE